MRCFIHIRFIDRDSAKLWFNTPAEMDKVNTAFLAATKDTVLTVPRDRGGSFHICMWNVTFWETGFEQ